MVSFRMNGRASSFESVEKYLVFAASSNNLIEVGMQ